MGQDYCVLVGPIRGHRPNLENWAISGPIVGPWIDLEGIEGLAYVVTHAIAGVKWSFYP